MVEAIFSYNQLRYFDWVKETNVNEWMNEWMDACMNEHYTLMADTDPSLWPAAICYNLLSTSTPTVSANDFIIGPSNSHLNYNPEGEKEKEK